MKGKLSTAPTAAQKALVKFAAALWWADNQAAAQMMQDDEARAALAAAVAVLDLGPEHPCRQMLHGNE